MGGTREVKGGSMYPPKYLDPVLQYLREHMIAYTSRLGKVVPYSVPKLKEVLAYLFGKGVIGCIETEERYAVVDATLQAKYWYLKEFEAEVIRWLDQNSRILRWRKLEP